MQFSVGLNTLARSDLVFADQEAPQAKLSRLNALLIPMLDMVE